MAHAAGTVGVLVAVPVLVRRGLLDPDPFPVRAQLVGRHHNQAGPDALAHFRAVVGHRDGAVIVDADEDVRVIDPAARHRLSAVFLLLLAQGEVPARGQDQRRAASQALEEMTAADVGEQQVVREGAHAWSSPASAA